MTQEELNKIDEDFDDKFRYSHSEDNLCYKDEVKEWYHSKLKEAYEKGKEEEYYKNLTESSIDLEKYSKKNRNQTLEEVEKKIEGRLGILRELYKKFNLVIDENRIDELEQFLQTIKEMKK